MEIDAQLDALKSSGAETLARLWKRYFRSRYPGHLPQSLVAQLLCYQIQADIFGDLAPEERAYLRNVVVGKEKVHAFGAKASGHQPGTVFVREYAGHLHRAVKTTSGFEWNGREFRSLSAVAFAITGTKWNGLRFFGIQAVREKNDG